MVISDVPEVGGTSVWENLGSMTLWSSTDIQCTVSVCLMVSLTSQRVSRSASMLGTFGPRGEPQTTLPSLATLPVRCPPPSLHARSSSLFLRSCSLCSLFVRKNAILSE